MPDVGAALNKKIGPLPVFAWGAVIAGGIFFARNIGQASEMPESDATEVTDGYSDTTQFPAGQLVPITGDEHLTPISPYTIIPAPETGGVIIGPEGDPIVFQPLPSNKTDTATQSPTIQAFGTTFHSTDKWVYLRLWKLDRRRRKLKYDWNAWQRFLNNHIAIVRFFRFTGSRAEWARVVI